MKAKTVSVGTNVHVILSINIATMAISFIWNAVRLIPVVFVCVMFLLISAHILSYSKLVSGVQQHKLFCKVMLL